jgi:hypothetical protein
MFNNITVLNMAVHKCTLTSLYPDFDTRLIVYEKLTEWFEGNFEKVLKDVQKDAPYLMCAARYFENQLKNLFIEEGRQLYTILDLEKLLTQLNYLNIERFKKQKTAFEEKRRRKKR